MVYWYEVLLLYIVFFLVPTLGVDPSREACLPIESDYQLKQACECVVFQSNGLSQGHFHSPDYPKRYPSLNCVLFSFIGDVNEIVEINFVDMNLKPKNPNPAIGCTDRIRIYKNLDRAGINENIRSDDELCGNLSSLKDKKFFSSGRALVFEFHSEYDPDPRSRYTGFKGIYTFLEKTRCKSRFDRHIPGRCSGAFKTDGVLEHGTQCSYHIQSASNYTTGKFFSPKYPQKYSKSASCQYMFHGRESEIVKVIFKIIKLPKQISIHSGCDNGGDVIRVYDGRDSSAKLINSICDTHNQVQTQSSGPYMYIEFMSDTQHEKQGFAAEYEFIDIKHPVRNPTNQLILDPKAKILNCNESIKSEDHKKNGTILSPLHPNTYPTSIICEYEFHAQGHERIQLKFTEMNLYYSTGDPNDPYECSRADSIKVFIYIEEKEEAIGEFCGKKPPPQLMSNGQRMKVIFKSESMEKDGNSGFKLEYSFRTDFGIQGNGRQDDRAVCKFMFHSTVHSQGYFTSPNYGGHYPRNTKCEFIFAGRVNEVVQINFPEFEVDGLNPRCEGHTQSDYVSFSNFLHAEDRKMPRYCGNRRSYDPVISDAAFFRVTFESNERFDANGFKGIYTFREDEEKGQTPFPTKQEPVSGENSGFRVNASVTMVTIILLCNSVIDYMLRH